MDKRVVELIPLDMLHYNPISKEYDVLSPEEAELIVLRCYESMKDVLPDSDLFQYAKDTIDYWNLIKISNLLYDRFLNGKILLIFDEDGEATFSSVQEEIVEEYDERQD